MKDLQPEWENPPCSIRKVGLGAPDIAVTYSQGPLFGDSPCCPGTASGSVAPPAYARSFFNFHHFCSGACLPS